MIVSLKIAGWPVLVVGGGAVGLRKVETLVRDGALVTVIAPEIGASPLSFERRLRPYAAGDCAGFWLVFACTDVREINAAVAQEARDRGIPCNIADAPHESDFANVATVRRCEIEIGISTGGASPVLARHLRDAIESAIGDEYAVLAEILAARRAAFTVSQTPEARAAAWRAVLESDVLDLLRAGDRPAAERSVDEILNRVFDTP